jgi:hypothetical protein
MSVRLDGAGRRLIMLNTGARVGGRHALFMRQGINLLNV